MREQRENEIRFPRVHVAEREYCGDDRGKNDTNAIGLPVRAGANLARRAMMVDVVVDDEPVEQGRFFRGFSQVSSAQCMSPGDEVGDEQADYDAAGVGGEGDDDIHVPTVAAGIVLRRP